MYRRRVGVLEIKSFHLRFQDSTPPRTIEKVETWIINDVRL